MDKLGIANRDTQSGAGALMHLPVFRIRRLCKTCGSGEMQVRALREIDLVQARKLKPGSRLGALTKGKQVSHAMLENEIKQQRVMGTLLPAIFIGVAAFLLNGGRRAAGLDPMGTILTTFASVIAVGVVYNHARIALSERAWELASLRMLGFNRAEVSAMLLGEMAIVIAVALPTGMLLGRGLVGLIARSAQARGRGRTVHRHRPLRTDRQHRAERSPTARHGYWTVWPRLRGLSPPRPPKCGMARASRFVKSSGRNHLPRRVW